MASNDFIIRTMKPDELDIAIDWAASEGWNPGLYDAECFHVVDPNGFFIGLLNGDPVAMVSAVSYGFYGFMGFYIVKHELRNRTYGVQMWDAGLEHLSGCCIGLDSVRPELVSAKKPEFQPHFPNYRFKWTKKADVRFPPGIVHLKDIPFAEVARYDTEVFGTSREAFLHMWLSRPGTVCYAKKIQGKLRGFGVIRRCREGFKIGPLFADGLDDALSIFQALVSDVGEGSSVYLDVPAINQDALEIPRLYQMVEVFRTTRMYNKKPPEFPLNKWFGITSFELG